MSARLTLDERVELDRLRQLNRELQEELDLWRDSQRSASRCDYWRERFNLSRSHGLIIAELVNHAPEPVSKERLLQATAPSWRDHADGPELKIIDVYLCRIRKRLDAMGYPGAIKTHWGFGYSMSTDAAAALRPEETGRERHRALSGEVAA